MYDIAVSLGADCQTAYQLQVNGMRGAAYPFDWTGTDFQALYSLIDKELEGFFAKENLSFEYAGSDQCRIVDNKYRPAFVGRHDFKIIKENQGNEIIDYKMDFKSVPSFLADYEILSAKLQRRSNRWRDLVHSNKKILLVRREINREQADALTSLLSKKYPDLDYFLLAIDRHKETEQDWHLPKVENYCIKHLVPYQWEGDYSRWKEVLANFSVALSKKI